MLRAITISAILLAAGPAVANEAKENCASFSESAEIVMEVRQAGLPMREAMEVGDGDMWAALVQDAYDVPYYETNEYKQKAIREFGNQMYSVCYEAMSDG